MGPARQHAGDDKSIKYHDGGQPGQSPVVTLLQRRLARCATFRSVATPLITTAVDQRPPTLFLKNQLLRCKLEEEKKRKSFEAEGRCSGGSQIQTLAAHGQGGGGGKKLREKTKNSSIDHKSPR